MHKHEIWAQLLGRYPSWSSRETIVKLKAGGLKALIDQAYDNGVADGITTKTKADTQCGTPPTPSFDQIFGFASKYKNKND